MVWASGWIARGDSAFCGTAQGARGPVAPRRAARTEWRRGVAGGHAERRGAARASRKCSRRGARRSQAPLARGAARLGGAGGAASPCRAAPISRRSMRTGSPCEWMDMPRGAHDRVLLLLHGGGYNAGLAAHASQARRQPCALRQCAGADAGVPAGARASVSGGRSRMRSSPTVADRAGRPEARGDRARRGLRRRRARALDAARAARGGRAAAARGGAALALDRPHGLQSVVRQDAQARSLDHAGGPARGRAHVCGQPRSQAIR